VIDAQPLDLALTDQPQQQPVGIEEDVGVLHAHRGQLRDVEEATVVDLLGGDTPEAQPIRLLFDKRVQTVEAGRLAGATIELSQRAVEAGAKDTDTSYKARMRRLTISFSRFRSSISAALLI